MVPGVGMPNCRASAFALGRRCACLVQTAAGRCITKTISLSRIFFALYTCIRQPHISRDT